MGSSVRLPASGPRRAPLTAGIGALLGLVAAGAPLLAQQAPAALPAAPSAVVRTLVLPAGIPVQQESAGVMPLTLDQAIQLGLKDNLGVRLSRQQELSVRGQILTVENVLLPNLKLVAYSQAQEIDLAAMGFKPSALAGINIPGFDSTNIQEIVKVNTTSAQLQLSQPLVDVPALFLYRAARRATEATRYNAENEQGGVVLAVGGLYLRALADRAQLQNDQALVKQDQVVYDHAVAERDAGTGINLDVLRAQVELQEEQQAVLRDQNGLAKDKVALNREMGQPAGQDLDLTDIVPFAEFAALPLEEAKALAYANRKDLLSLQSQLSVATETERAVHFQRLPTLGIGGYYGVIGETTGSYHGVFAAAGQLQFPIFQEAVLRGQSEEGAAQITALRHQVDALRAQIDADLRTSMLDIDTSDRLVKIARSNQQLAAEELNDATSRFIAGVDDSLPVVRAQAALAGAEARLIHAEFEYNYAKLTLARNSGVVQREYDSYLGR